MTQVLDSVRVTHLPTAGRGGLLLEFSGDDHAAVQHAAITYWTGSDPWLRGERPLVSPATDGRYYATVRLWSAE
jgi:hypothetical protein